VLTKPSVNVVDCLQHAAECESQSARTSDPHAKQSFIDLAARWRRVAETFEYIQRVDSFISEIDRKSQELPKPKG